MQANSMQQQRTLAMERAMDETRHLRRISLSSTVSLHAYASTRCSTCAKMRLHGGGYVGNTPAAPAGLQLADRDIDGSITGSLFCASRPEASMKERGYAAS